MATQVELVEQRQAQRKQDKALAPQYLQAAKMLVSGCGSVTIRHSAHVVQMDDGAFVEAVIWVPKEQL